MSDTGDISDVTYDGLLDIGSAERAVRVRDMAQHAFLGFRGLDDTTNARRLAHAHFIVDVTREEEGTNVDRATLPPREAAAFALVEFDGDVDRAVRDLLGPDPAALNEFWRQFAWMQTSDEQRLDLSVFREMTPSESHAALKFHNDRGIATGQEAWAAGDASTEALNLTRSYAFGASDWLAMTTEEVVVKQGGTDVAALATLWGVSQSLIGWSDNVIGFTPVQGARRQLVDAIRTRTGIDPRSLDSEPEMWAARSLRRAMQRNETYLPPEVGDALSLTNRQPFQGPVGASRAMTPEEVTLEGAFHARRGAALYRTVSNLKQLGEHDPLVQESVRSWRGEVVGKLNLTVNQTGWVDQASPAQLTEAWGDLLSVGLVPGVPRSAPDDLVLRAGEVSEALRYHGVNLRTDLVDALDSGPVRERIAAEGKLGLLTPATLQRQLETWNVESQLTAPVSHEAVIIPVATREVETPERRGPLQRLRDALRGPREPEEDPEPDRATRLAGLQGRALGPNHMVAATDRAAAGLPEWRPNAEHRARAIQGIATAAADATEATRFEDGVRHDAAQRTPGPLA